MSVPQTDLKSVVCADWLTEQLNVKDPIKIVDYKIEDSEEASAMGFFGNYFKVKITYNNNNNKNFPENIFVKYTKDFTGDPQDIDFPFLVSRFKMHSREVLFYRSFSSKLSFVPRAWSTHVSEDDSGYLILEDILPEDLPNAITFVKGLDLNQTITVINHLAKYHVTSMTLDPQIKSSLENDLSKFEVLSPSFIRRSFNGFAKLKDIAINHQPPVLTPEQISYLRNFSDIESLVQQYFNVTCECREMNNTFWHGDIWSGNLVQPLGSSDVFLLDWQFFGKNPGIGDLAFFFLSSLNSAIMKNIKDLVFIYFRALQENGISAEYPFEVIFRDYLKCRILGFAPFVVSVDPFLDMAKTEEEKREINLRLTLATQHFFFASE